MVFPRSPEESLPQAPGNRRRRRRRASPEDAQRQSERRALDTRRQKIAIGIGVGLILVVLGIVGVGYYLEFFRPPRELAGQVRDVRFTMGDLVDRIRVLQGINRYQGGRVDLSTVPFEYLQDMIQAEIVRQAAPVWVSALPTRILTGNCAAGSGRSRRRARWWTRASWTRSTKTP